jgi:hypothetical protein
MAIVHMNKRVENFFHQLEWEAEDFVPELQFFDYGEKSKTFKYDEEVIISTRDFDIEFDLIVEQTGEYTPEDYCQPEEFTPYETTVEIQNLTVFDNIYGEQLRFNREEFTDLVQKVKNLIEI